MDIINSFRFPEFFKEIPKYFNQLPPKQKVLAVFATAIAGLVVLKVVRAVWNWKASVLKPGDSQSADKIDAATKRRRSRVNGAKAVDVRTLPTGAHVHFGTMTGTGTFRFDVKGDQNNEGNGSSTKASLDLEAEVSRFLPGTAPRGLRVGPNGTLTSAVSSVQQAQYTEDGTSAQEDLPAAEEVLAPVALSSAA